MITIMIGLFFIVFLGEQNVEQQSFSLMFLEKTGSSPKDTFSILSVQEDVMSTSPSLQKREVFPSSM